MSAEKGTVLYRVSHARHGFSLIKEERVPCLRTNKRIVIDKYVSGKKFDRETGRCVDAYRRFAQYHYEVDPASFESSEEPLERAPA